MQDRLVWGSENSNSENISLRHPDAAITEIAMRTFLVLIVVLSASIVVQDEDAIQQARRERLLLALRSEVAAVAALPFVMQVEEMKASLDLEAATTRRLELVVKKTVTDQVAQLDKALSSSLEGARSTIPEVVILNGRRVPIVDSPKDPASPFKLVISPQNGQDLWCQVNGSGSSLEMPKGFAETLVSKMQVELEKAGVPAAAIARYHANFAKRKKVAIVNALHAALTHHLQLRSEQSEAVRAWIVEHLKVEKGGVLLNISRQLPSLWWPGNLPKAGPPQLTALQKRMWECLYHSNIEPGQW